VCIVIGNVKFEQIVLSFYTVIKVKPKRWPKKKEGSISNFFVSKKSKNSKLYIHIWYFPILLPKFSRYIYNENNYNTYEVKVYNTYFINFNKFTFFKALSLSTLLRCMKHTFIRNCK
jgi:hypothetical protein